MLLTCVYAEINNFMIFHATLPQIIHHRVHVSCLLGINIHPLDWEDTDTDIMTIPCTQNMHHWRRSKKYLYIASTVCVLDACHNSRDVIFILLALLRDMHIRYDYLQLPQKYRIEPTYATANTTVDQH